MACPQCGSEVPPDDAFCGKCGYAMREGAPERVDQSRIRVHEEPDPLDASKSGSSQQRIRKATMVGMPALTPSKGPKPPEPPKPPDEAPPPTQISTARERAGKRTPQKTMLGIPRPDIVPPPTPSTPAEPESPTGADGAAAGSAPADSSAEGSSRPHRARARVRYDSANESYPMLARRKKALRGLGLLVLLAGAWFVYRFLTLNG